MLKRSDEKMGYGKIGRKLVGFGGELKMGLNLVLVTQSNCKMMLEGYNIVELSLEKLDLRWNWKKLS